MSEAGVVYTLLISDVRVRSANRIVILDLDHWIKHGTMTPSDAREFAQLLIHCSHEAENYGRKL